jgi:zinc protease
VKRLAILVLLLAGCAPRAATPAAAGAGTAKPAASPMAAVSPVAAAITPAPTPVPTQLSFPEGDAFREAQPKAGPLAPFKQPAITIFPLGASGITVYLVERHELPTVWMNLTFEGGAIDDPPGKEGTASLCMELMSQGTEKLDRIALQEAEADLASSVSSGSGTDQQWVTMSSLSESIDQTLDLWADTLLHPGLRQEELDRDVKERLDDLREEKGAPDAIASRVNAGIIWGPQHVYGRVDTETSVQAVTLADCKAHIGSFVKPKGAQLFVVGDLTKAQILDKVAKRLGGFQGAPKASAKIGPPKPRDGRVFVVDVPEAPQSVISILQAGPARKAPDFLPTYLMAQVLGGDFSSRINMNIRERHGYAYGAYGGFSYFRTGSVFYAGGSVRTDVTAESIHEILSEAKRIREAPVGDDELDREKNGEVLSLPASFATASDVLGTYQHLLYYGLPLDYYEHYIPKVQAVTKQQVLDAALAHLDPKEFKILVVGDGKQILPKLKDMMKSGELGAGDLVMLDADGNAVAQ